MKIITESNFLSQNKIAKLAVKQTKLRQKDRATRDTVETLIVRHFQNCERFPSSRGEHTEENAKI